MARVSLVMTRKGRLVSSWRYQTCGSCPVRVLDEYKANKDRLHLWKSRRAISVQFLIHHRSMPEKKVVESGSDTHDVTDGQIFSHSDGDIAAVYADKLYGNDAHITQEEK